jgi:hypothetical protein
VLDRALGAWLWTRAARSGGRLVIAIDGKAVRGAKGKTGQAPHLVAALAHGIGAVPGQVAVDAKSNEIPAVRELLKAFAGLAGAVLTIDAMHAQHDTAQLRLVLCTSTTAVPVASRHSPRSGSSSAAATRDLRRPAAAARWRSVRTAR